MLFSKKIPRSCRYCSHGTQATDEQIICNKHGVVSVHYACRKFEYDPCKRIPVKAKALNLKKYDDEDFSI
mgnify:CR=1 FL=1